MQRLLIRLGGVVVCKTDDRDQLIMIIKKDCLHLFCTSFDLLCQMTMPRSLLGDSIVCPLQYFHHCYHSYYHL